MIIVSLFWSSFIFVFFRAALRVSIMLVGVAGFTLTTMTESEPLRRE